MTQSLTHRFGPILGATLLCLAAAACNRASDASGTSLEQTIAAPQGPASSQMLALTTNGLASRAPSQPIAALPEEAGTVASLRSHDYVNGFRQDILLKGKAVRAVPNSLTVLARTSRQPTLDEATPLFQPTEAAIRAELGRQFPHIAMQVVERPSSNAYGPYGLALGRGEGTVHCLYMWQWIDENRLPQEAGVSGPMSVRIRLCQANTTFDAMAVLVDHLTIGQAAATSYRLAANESDGIVRGPTDDDRPKPARHRHANRVAPRHTKTVADAQSEPAHEDALVVPQAVAAGSAMPVPLSPDLPPQAYLGPRAARPTNTPEP